MQKRIIIFITIIIITGIVFSLTYDPSLEREPPEIKNKTGGPEEELKDIKIKLMQENNITWEIKSEGIQRYTDNGLLELASVIINAYDVDFRQLYNISAGSGQYYLSGKRLILEGPIKIKGEETELKMERLIWNQNKKELLGRGGVTISGPEYCLQGEEVIFKPNLELVSITGKKGEQARLHWKEDFH